MASSTKSTASCCVCSSAREDLCRLSCGDAICRQCIDGQLERQSPSAQMTCPACEAYVDVPVVDLQKESLQTDTFDEGTNNVFMGSTIAQKASQHASAASRLAPVAAKVESQKDEFVHGTSYCGASGPAAEMERVIIKDRNTFCCPYCQKGRYDRRALVQHCLEQHTADSNQEQVCPLCAAEPWGNAEQTSRNFIEHLAYRHQFDYDAYIRRDMDEDEALKMAIKRSLNQ